MPEREGLQSTRIDLEGLIGSKSVLLGRTGKAGRSVPAATATESNPLDDMVDHVLGVLSSSYKDLMAQEILDTEVSSRVRSAIRAIVQQERVSATEVERVVRLCETRIFGIGDLSAVLSDLDILEIQMLGPDYATSRHRTLGLRKDPRVRFRSTTNPVKELQHYAQLHKAELDAQMPYATFMSGPWRVSIHVRPHIATDFTLTMRRVGAANMMDETQFLASGTVSREVLDILYGLVDGYQTLLTFAPQRSGKTWLQRLLIDHMDPSKGTILLIEDIPEIQPSIPVMSFHTVHRDSDPIDMMKLSEWSLRESAVRVILGEFRQQEAGAFIDITQQGTSGLTTGHGGNAVQITNRLVDAYRRAVVGTPEESAYRKIHEAIGFYIEMRRFEDPKTRTESFRLRGIYEVQPTTGYVTTEHYRPIVMYRHEGFDPVTHMSVGHHEIVGRLSDMRYEDCLIRSSYAVDIPAAIRPLGAKGAGQVVSAP